MGERRRDCGRQRQTEPERGKQNRHTELKVNKSTALLTTILVFLFLKKKFGFPDRRREVHQHILSNEEKATIIQTCHLKNSRLDLVEQAKQMAVSLFDNVPLLKTDTNQMAMQVHVEKASKI